MLAAYEVWLKKLYKEPWFPVLYASDLAMSWAVAGDPGS